MVDTLKLILFMKAVDSIFAISVEAGLPNITGSLKLTPAQTLSKNVPYGAGMCSKTMTSPTGDCNSGGNVQPTYNAQFDASLSNSIYGNSNTVTPSSLSCKVILKY